MLRDQQSWTRRSFLMRLTLLVSLTAATGCGSEPAEPAQLNDRGGKFKALTEKDAGTSRRRAFGPIDMRPVEGDH